MSSRRLSGAIIAALMMSMASLAVAQAGNDEDDTPQYGYYGMGPGMMYGGPGTMGPGMMYGGPGMMGPGMMYGGQGGYGRGMGPGMHGYGGMMGGCPGGYGPGYGRGYGRGTLGFGPMYNLSPEKRKKITDIESRFEKTYWDNVGKIQSQYGELQKLYASGKPDPKAVGDVYGKIFNLRRQIIEARVRAQNEARDVLSQ